MTTLAAAALLAAVISCGGCVSSEPSGPGQRASERPASSFLEKLRGIDDGAIWSCALARPAPGRELPDQVVEGLRRAYAASPKTQPDRLAKRCIPIIDATLREVGKLEPPWRLTDELERYAAALKEGKTALEAYTRRLEQRNRDAAVEQEIIRAHRDFHSVIIPGGGFAHPEDTPDAVAYFNLLSCLIPDLVQRTQKIDTPPDSGPVVEAIYRRCSASPGFVERIRSDCHARRNVTRTRSASFKLVARRMSGDERDLYALEHCFSAADRGFLARAERGVGRAFGEYKKARSALLAGK